jgi:hypothetical protein
VCTGEVGNGKVFVMPVEKVYRIRTGEADAAVVTPRFPERRRAFMSRSGKEGLTQRHGDAELRKNPSASR